MLIKLVLAIVIYSALASADQERPCPSAEESEIARLQALADQVKGALGNGNLVTARQLASELAHGVTCREKSLQFRTLEAQLPADRLERIYPLAGAAHAAYDASDYTKAEAYAWALLSLAAQYPEEEAAETAIFSGNMVLGRVVLGRDHNIPEAKAALLASGRTRGRGH